MYLRFNPFKALRRVVSMRSSMLEDMARSVSLIEAYGNQMLNMGRRPHDDADNSASYPRREIRL